MMDSIEARRRYIDDECWALIHRHFDWREAKARRFGGVVSEIWMQWYNAMVARHSELLYNNSLKISWPEPPEIVA